MKKKINFEHFNFVNRKWYFLLFSFCLFWFIAVPILTVITKMILRIRFKNRHYFKQIKKSGAVIVSNHIHEMDSSAIAISILPYRSFIASLEHNFYFKVGFLIRGLGGVPLPQDLRYQIKFLDAFGDLARAGKKVLIFPEGHLIRRCSEMREFKTGAFRVAASANIPIVPIVFTYKGKRMTLNFLPPIYKQADEDHKELTARTFKIMNDFFVSEMAKNNKQ